MCGVDFLRCAKQRPQTAHRVLDYFLRPEYAFSRRLERVKCIDASVLHFASERFRLSGGVVKASMVVPRRAAIAHWICLQLPSCHPGFKPQAHHLCIRQFIELCNVEKTKINKKEAGIDPFKKTRKIEAFGK